MSGGELVTGENFLAVTGRSDGLTDLAMHAPNGFIMKATLNQTELGRLIAELQSHARPTDHPSSQVAP